MKLSWIIIAFGIILLALQLVDIMSDDEEQLFALARGAVAAVGDDHPFAGNIASAAADGDESELARILEVGGAAMHSSVSYGHSAPPHDS